LPDPITENIQEMNVGTRIELWKFDFNKAGIPIADTFYTSSYDKLVNGYILYDSQTYLPIQMSSSGFNWDGAGKLPTPLLTFTNVLEAFTSLNYLYDDLSGVEVTRTITFEKFLDKLRNGDPNPDADPDAHLPVEIFRIDQKTNENELEVSYQLNASIDQEGQKIPKRQFTRNYCPYLYRQYNPNLPEGQDFDYSNVTCPYDGSNYFDKYGNSVDDPGEDECSHQLHSGCRKRYGIPNALNQTTSIPFGGFPGLANLPT
jgi:lambda family phage minor tail protein L